MAFYGEEMGLLGFDYFTKNPTVDLKTLNFTLVKKTRPKGQAFKRELC